MLEAEAFGKQFERLRPVLRSHAELSVGQDAEDLVQDVYIVASERLATYDTRASLRGWLIAILNNLMSAHTRKRAREVTLTALAWEQIEHSSEFPRADVRDAVMFRLRFADCPSGEKLALRMRLDGHSTEVIAKYFRVSARTIRRSIQNAVLACQLANADLLAFSDLDQHVLRRGQKITLYHAPTCTGSALAREQLADLAKSDARHDAYCNRRKRT